MAKTRRVVVRVGILLAAMATVMAAACVGLPVAIPAADEAAAEVTTAEVAPEATEEGGVELSGVLTGTATYLQRIALEPGAVVNVQLQDVSLADAPATVISQADIVTEGENVPIPFELSYDPAAIDPRFTYAVRATITVEGQLRWTTTQQYAVLTRGAPLTGVELVLEQVP